jgi:hypothetical protein
MPLSPVFVRFDVTSMSIRKSLATNLREHLGIYVLASFSNVFLSVSQYLTISSAVASYLPVDPSTAALITSYGRGLGIVLALVENSLVFQGILAVLVAILAMSSATGTGWRWAYAFSGVVISSFVGYWLGTKFLSILDWISTLQNNRVDSSNTYAGLFWFGLASTICYVLMILVLRRAYGKLSERYASSIVDRNGSR